MMRKAKKPVVMLLAVIAVIGLLVCCAPSGAPSGAGAGEEVPVGLNLSLTGGLAACTMPVSYGVLDYFTYINDEGGFEYTSPIDGEVHHAKYNIMWADNAFSVARSMTIFKRFADAGAVFMFTP